LIEYITKIVPLLDFYVARVDVDKRSHHDIDELALFARSVHGVLTTARLTMIRRLDRSEGGDMVLFGLWSHTSDVEAGTREEWITLYRAWEGFTGACPGGVYFCSQFDTGAPVDREEDWWQIYTEDADLPWNNRFVSFDWTRP
jgi:hypothetical protein